MFGWGANKLSDDDWRRITDDQINLLNRLDDVQSDRLTKLESGKEFTGEAVTNLAKSLMQLTTKLDAHIEQTIKDLTTLNDRIDKSAVLFSKLDETVGNICERLAASAGITPQNWHDLKTRVDELWEWSEGNEDDESGFPPGVQPYTPGQPIDFEKKNPRSAAEWKPKLQPGDEVEAIEAIQPARIYEGQILEVRGYSNGLLELEGKAGFRFDEKAFKLHYRKHPWTEGVVCAVAASKIESGQVFAWNPSDGKEHPVTTMSRKFMADQNYADGWHDNIASAAQTEGVDYETSQRIARNVMKLAFDVVTRHPRERTSCTTSQP